MTKIDITREGERRQLQRDDVMKEYIGEEIGEGKKRENMSENIKTEGGKLAILYVQSR